MTYEAILASTAAATLTLAKIRRHIKNKTFRPPAASRPQPPRRKR